MAPTIDRLRYGIDNRRTGDKFAACDPAAAPLGTDEEAAGTPVSAESVQAARAYETSAAGTMRRDAGVRIWLATMATLALVTLLIWALLPV
jgi:hypothetical protein